MSDEQKFQIAKEYVDQQLETMRGFDAAPSDISDEEYTKLIDDVADMVQV